MKLLDLFSGIGGFSLAARWTGRILTAAFCETDPYCCKVLEKNFPGVPIYGDIRNLKGADVGTADIISGGFPCQPFSVAGKRCGTEDDRYLWPEMLRVVSDVRPTWVVGENVDGLVRMGVRPRVLKVESRNLERTEDFDRLRRILTREEVLLLFSLLDDLEALGYGAVPLVIPACGVDAPHLRYRVWIVGHSDRPRWDSRQPAGATMGHGGSIIATGGHAHVADASRRGRHGESGVEGQGSAKRRGSAEGGQDDANAIGINDDNGRYGTGAILWERREKAELSGSEDVAHPPGRGLGTDRGTPGIAGHADLRGQNVAYPEVGTVEAGLRTGGTGGIGRGRPGDGGCEDVPDAYRPGRGELRGAEPIGKEHAAAERRGRWLPEPSICRVADGVPARVDRLRSLGNSIVPQVAYEIMMGILRAEETP